MFCQFRRRTSPDVKTLGQGFATRRRCWGGTNRVPTRSGADLVRGSCPGRPARLDRDGCHPGGEVIAVNEKLEDEPETVNADPYNDGWFFKLKPDDTAELEGLMSAEEYQQHCEDE